MNERTRFGYGADCIESLTTSSMNPGIDNSLSGTGPGLGKRGASFSCFSILFGFKIPLRSTSEFASSRRS